MSAPRLWRQEIVERWNTFWFLPIPTYSISRIRVFVGLLVIMKLTGLHGLYRIQDWKIKPKSWFEGDCYLDGYRLPVDGFEWLPVPSCDLAQYFDTLALALGVLLAVGLFTRVVGPLLALLFLEIYLLSQVTDIHHVSVLTTVMLLLVFWPCGDHYSLDALLRKRRPEPLPMRPATSLRMLQVFTSALYFSTFVAKLNGGWLDGRMMSKMNEMGMLKGYSEPILGLLGPRMLGHTTLFAEGLLIFALWFPRWRRFGIFTGVLFHVGIDLMMDVTTFGYQMMVLYGAFVDPYPGRTVVVYDPRDARHVFLRRICWALDWLDRVTWVDRSNASAAGLALKCEGIVVLTPRAEALSGWGAGLEVLSLLPLTFIPTFALTLLLLRRSEGPASDRPAPIEPGEAGWQATLRARRLAAGSILT